MYAIRSYYGQIISPSHLDPNMNGLWGGLVILGNATISADASPFQIEGIPASDANGLYGGTNDADNSGTIQYVSIRHGRITSYNVCYTKLLRSKHPKFFLRNTR